MITLCECKLDRNAGSRREVLGQILEYGGSLHGMKFGDFRRLVSDRIDADLVDAMRDAPETTSTPSHGRTPLLGASRRGASVSSSPSTS